MRDMGEQVNQEAKIAQAQPVLNARSFQHLLAAAYLLQLRNDHRLSVPPIDIPCASPSAAGSITQYQTQPWTIQGQVRAGRPSTPLGGEAAKENARWGSLEPFEPTFLRRVMSWKTVEALAIAIVLCAMMGLSIHRLSAQSGNVSLFRETLDRRNVLQRVSLVGSASASDRQTLMRRTSWRRVNSEGDFVAKNMTSTRWVRFLSERAAGRPKADTVVHYGPDVTMWLTNFKPASPTRLKR